MGTLQSQMKTHGKTRKTRGHYDKPHAVRNKAGGLAYTVPDSANKLIYITGQFIGEPKYYDGSQVTPVHGKQAESRTTVLNAKLATGGILQFAQDVLDENVKEVVSTAMAVANSDNPKDLLVLANWLRNEMNMRLTPALFLTIGAVNAKTKGDVRKYCPQVIQRLDDVFNVVEFWNFLFGGRLPNCLSRGLSDALMKFDERGILKYGIRKAHPNLADVLKIVDRSKNRPFSKEVSEFIFNRTVPAESVSPRIYNWCKLMQCTEFDEEARAFAKAAGVTWEELVSQFGQSAEQKKAVWTFLFENKLVPYMATLRNLANLVRAKVDNKVIENACTFLSNPEMVKRSRQLPFRYLSAYKIVEGMKHEMDQFVFKKVSGALESAIATSAESIIGMEGRSAAFADNSGSMDSTVSGKSTVMISDVANTLVAIFGKMSDSIVGAFGTDVAFVDMDGVPILKAAQMVKRANTKGMATNGYRCLEELLVHKSWVDRVVLFTDMELWSTGGGWGYSDRQLAPVWAKYEKACAAATGKKPFLHLVNLAGTTTTPADSNNPQVNLMGGYSEKVLNLMTIFEGATEEKQAANLPAIEDLRERF